MSSFIHSADHFNKVESSIKMMLSGSLNDIFRWDVRKYIDARTMGVDAIHEAVEELIDAIKELSVICVNLQYAHHNEGKVDELIASEVEWLKGSRKFDSAKLSNVELLKAIQSLHYQIETEHLKGIRELTVIESRAMEFLEACEDSLLRIIVMNSQEYNDAKWSI